jgi:hypothetical protein
MILPASAVSTAASAIPALSSVQGLNQPVPLNFNVTGTHLNPKVSFAGVSKSFGGGVKERAKAEVDKAVDQAKDRAKEEADRLRKENEDRLKKEAEDRARQELEKLKNKFKFPK